MTIREWIHLCVNIFIHSINQIQEFSIKLHESGKKSLMDEQRKKSICLAICMWLFGFFLRYCCTRIMIINCWEFTEQTTWECENVREKLPKEKFNFHLKKEKSFWFQCNLFHSYRHLKNYLWMPFLLLFLFKFPSPINVNQWEKLKKEKNQLFFSREFVRFPLSRDLQHQITARE